MQISAFGSRLIILCKYRNCDHITRAVKTAIFFNKISAILELRYLEWIISAS